MCYYPLSTDLGVYKILFLIAVRSQHAEGETINADPPADSCRVYHALGLLPDPHSGMDLSS